MGDIYKIKEFGYLQKGMDMLIARQNAIMSNVANASTPGYRAHRIVFEDSLKSAIGGGVKLSETHPKHLPNNMKGVYGMKPEVTVSLSSPRLDGNNVDLDREFTLGAANTIAYNAMIAAASKRFRTLLSVFNGAGGGQR